MDTAVLEKAGMEKADAEVYIALLKNGLSTATAISRETRVERTRVYRVLEMLIDKGLVTFITENKVKKFRAVEPERLLFELKEKEKELSAYLPKLKSLAREKEHEPKIEIYRGEGGVRSLCRELLTLRQDYDVVGGEVIPGMEQFFELFMKAIEEANIHERVLVKEGMQIAKSKNTEIMYLPKNYDYTATTGISANKVGIILWAKPFFAVEIEDESLAKTYRSYFELLWTKVAHK